MSSDRELILIWLVTSPKLPPALTSTKLQIAPLASKRLKRLNGAVLGHFPSKVLFSISPWACGAVPKRSEQAKVPTFTKTTATSTFAPLPSKLHLTTLNHIPQPFSSPKAEQPTQVTKVRRLYL
ncbi:MAG: hypothetical protein ACTS5F_00820 [Candidatus Hodgkinia cicadicola]